MSDNQPTRRQVIAAAGAAGLGSAGLGYESKADTRNQEGRGRQRLSLEQLGRWEELRYGMFIHYGMSTFVGLELPTGRDPASVYAPERLDVDQWIKVARDAGMKYAVLTAKHTAGHCLWPTRHSSYSVGHGPDKTDVVEKFVEACRKYGVLPGLYYCSWDNHHRFGSRTPSDPDTPWCSGKYDFLELEKQESAGARNYLPAYVSSLYQDFQTRQIIELLTDYGPIAEMWIDIPGILGWGYRTYLYDRIAQLQPDTVIVMNSGLGAGAEYSLDYAWPSDVIVMERALPPDTGHQKWRTIEGKRYYVPGEVCDPIGKEWFYVPGDEPRPDHALAEQLGNCLDGKVNFLLDVPPDNRGLIPDSSVQALMRLRKNAGL